MSDYKIKFDNNALKELEEAALVYFKDVCEAVKNRAKELAPVDTGLLRDSIDIYEGETKKEKYIGTILVPYAIFQEMGTVKMAPNSYLRPALDEITGNL